MCSRIIWKIQFRNYATGLRPSLVRSCYNNALLQFYRRVTVLGFFVSMMNSVVFQVMSHLIIQNSDARIFDTSLKVPEKY